MCVCVCVWVGGWVDTPTQRMIKGATAVTKRKSCGERMIKGATAATGGRVVEKNIKGATAVIGERVVEKE